MKRNTPLQRKTPLKSSTPLRPKQPLAKVGVAARRRLPWLEQERQAVIARSKGKCEVPRCLQDGQSVHHLFGRVNIIAEPYASSRHMMIFVCEEPHHRLLTNNFMKETHDWLRKRAILRLALSLNINLAVEYANLLHGNGIDIARKLTDEFQANGIFPVEYK